MNLSGLYGFRDGYVHNLSLNDYPDTQDTLSGRARTDLDAERAVENRLDMLRGNGSMTDLFPPTGPGAFTFYLPPPAAPPYPTGRARSQSFRCQSERERL